MLGCFRKRAEHYRVVSSATRYVAILTDWIGYSMYSDEQQYLDFISILKKLRVRDRPVTVLIIAYSDTCAEEYIKIQFPRANSTRRGKQHATRTSGEPIRTCRRNTNVSSTSS